MAWMETGRGPYRTDWLCWLGQPMLYDGGLCVNRTLEEKQYSDVHKGKLEV